REPRSYARARGATREIPDLGRRVLALSEPSDHGSDRADPVRDHRALTTGDALAVGTRPVVGALPRCLRATPRPPGTGPRAIRLLAVALLRDASADLRALRLARRLEPRSLDLALGLLSLPVGAVSHV